MPISGGANSVTSRIRTLKRALKFIKVRGTTNQIHKLLQSAHTKCRIKKMSFLLASVYFAKLAESFHPFSAPAADSPEQESECKYEFWTIITKAQDKAIVTYFKGGLTDFRTQTQAFWTAIQFR